MRVTWEYVAGYFDGEGSAGIHTSTRVATIRFHNTHLQSLQAIRNFLGVGKIYAARLKPRGKQGYTLAFSRAADVAPVAEQLLPRVIIKREALQRALDFSKAVLANRIGRLKKFCTHGHPFDEENTSFYTLISGKRQGQRVRKCRACQREGMTRRRRALGVLPSPHPRKPATFYKNMERTPTGRLRRRST